MVVESRSVIRNAKNARVLGRDRAALPFFPPPSPPFPSRARLIFALLVLIRSQYTIWELYYLRAWHRLVYKERGLPFCCGYPSKRVKVSSGLQATSSPGRFSLALEVWRPPMPGKSALAGDEVGLQANFTGRVTLSPGSTLQALLTCYVMRAFFVTVQNLK